MKKFNFSFKFLDRFKKSNASQNEVEEITDSTDHSDSDVTSPAINLPKDDSMFSEENPEIFAEKTLNGFKPEKDIFSEENQNTRRDQLEEEIEDASEFVEMEPPRKPEAVSRFKFKFPTFNRAASEKNIRDRFASASPMKSINKFNWNDFVLKIFSPYTRSKVHGVFIILLVVTFTYLIGKSTALFFGRSTPIVSNVKSNITIPIEKPDTGVQDINRISSTNLFNVKESDKVEVKEEKKDIASIVCIDAERPTSEPLKLLDTIVLQDSVKSVASVQVRGSSELVNVREGEQLNETVEVAKINRMKIILKNLTTGDCEYIANEEEGAVSPEIVQNMKILSPKAGQKLFKSNNPNIKNTGNNFSIKRQFRDQMINNMSEVLTQAKAIQITNPDGSLSFKMTEIVPGSIYSNLNIQNDDIITSINGKKIENLNELMTLMGRMKEIDQFQIGLKRNGMTENLEYGFE